MLSLAVRFDGGSSTRHQASAFIRANAPETLVLVVPSLVIGISPGRVEGAELGLALNSGLCWDNLGGREQLRID